MGSDCVSKANILKHQKHMDYRLPLVSLKENSGGSANTWPKNKTTDFVSSATMNLEGSTSPETNILSFGQGASLLYEHSKPLMLPWDFTIHLWWECHSNHFLQPNWDPSDQLPPPPPPPPNKPYTSPCFPPGLSADPQSSELLLLLLLQQLLIFLQYQNWIYL